jgi:hypothetical protein
MHLKSYFGKYTLLLAASLDAILQVPTSHAQHENYFSIISTFWTNSVRSNESVSFIHTANIISTIFNTAESDSAA